jgi:hypothetical protein
VFARECHHQCERDVQAHQARSNPSATQKAGFSRRRYRSLREMADGHRGWR